ncbi:hypothetical protein UN64_05420 [Fictibacillus arsenicus]|uniref:Uncharacterized protein n=2 Tax=Fictibacillus arsenicus TaxID=255247 RepID=A0A1V3GCW1_9BACL|nr:hypothetical protein UN64_05420 [Fictibacillus arsenicus]
MNIKQKKHKRAVNMKKTLIKWIVICVLVIGVLWAFRYFSHEGEFEKYSHVTIGKETLKEGKPVYLGYHLQWEGIGTPELQKVEFIKSDGTIVAKDDDQMRIKSYITKVDFGSYYEEDVIKEGIVNKLLPVKGFKADDDFSLVLQVEPNDFEWDSDIKTVRVMYKKFGQTQFQNISFDDGIISNE